MPSAVVIPGAGEPDQEQFKQRVGRFAARLGDDWELDPVWWSNRGRHLGAIREGLLSTYPPPPSEELQTGPTDSSVETSEWPPKLVPLAIWHGRKLFLDAFAGVLADALLYWGQREAIQRDVLSQLPPGPGVDEIPDIDVIAHSMGGIIAVDLAAERRVRIRTLVTFGTPVSAAYVLDAGRLGPLPFDPERPIMLGNVGAWTNLWNAYDYVALAVENVFTTNGRVSDFRVGTHGAASTPEHSDDAHVAADAHLAYWELEDVLEAVRAAFSRPTG